MRSLLFLASILFSFSIFAKPVTGDLYYKKGSGEIAHRAVTLEVPSRGEGEIVLSGNGFEWRSTDFWTTKRNGRTLFTVAFQTEFMDKKVVIALEGTYLNGTNEIIYSGNVFKKNGHEPVNRDLSDFVYIGGFHFSYDR